MSLSLKQDQSFVELFPARHPALGDDEHPLLQTVLECFGVWGVKPQTKFHPLTRLEMSYPQLTPPSGVGEFCTTDYLRHDCLLSATMGRIVAARLFRAVSHTGLVIPVGVKTA